MSLELEAMLEKAGLTEYQQGQWCQSGAQAGWGPDLDGHTPSVELVKEKVVRIYNDIYSPRVQEIEAGAQQLGYAVVLSYKPDCEVAR